MYDMRNSQNDHFIQTPKIIITFLQINGFYIIVSGTRSAPNHAIFTARAFCGVSAIFGDISYDPKNRADRNSWILTHWSRQFANPIHTKSQNILRWSRPHRVILMTRVMVATLPQSPGQANHIPQMTPPCTVPLARCLFFRRSTMIWDALCMQEHSNTTI